MEGWEVELETILKGIDFQETDHEEGWWETSTGAYFGKDKKKQIKDLIKKIIIPPELEKIIEQDEIVKWLKSLLSPFWMDHKLQFLNYLINLRSIQLREEYKKSEENPKEWTREYFAQVPFDPNIMTNGFREYRTFAQRFQAKRMYSDFVIHDCQGDMSGVCGDYILKSGGGKFFAIPEKVFETLFIL